METSKLSEADSKLIDNIIFDMKDYYGVEGQQGKNYYWFIATFLAHRGHLPDDIKVKIFACELLGEPFHYFRHLHDEVKSNWPKLLQTMTAMLSDGKATEKIYDFAPPLANKG